ncbi:universal stress protein [Kribbella ginsengisoli]|uniref:Universal stress protein n=1 Tax=Kribbella ginsengisoli TaxID=363865 RepID=A0ABP6YX51_9ACTN
MTEARVVAGIDGSPMAEAAIRWAATEAASRGTGLSLVHAFVWPEFPVPLGGNDLAPGLRAGADKVVRESVELARKLEPTIEVEGTRVDGFPSPVLLRASKHAEVVVIGSRGLGIALGALAGSTGLDLAANAHCPVVVVRSGLTPATGSRVVVGYDGSPASALALDFGLDYARRHHLRLRVVAAQPLHTEHDRVSAQALEADVRSREGGQDAELIHIDGHPAEQLLRMAADAQLIVLGSRGRGGFAGMLLGSVSQTVLHHAACPVAVIPAGMIGG